MEIFSQSSVNIQQAKTGIFKAVGDIVRNKPEQLLNDIEKITSRLTDDESKSKLFAFPYVSILIILRITPIPIDEFCVARGDLKTDMDYTAAGV